MFFNQTSKIIKKIAKNHKSVLTKKFEKVKYTSLAEQNRARRIEKFFKNESRQSVWALAEFMS